MSGKDWGVEEPFDVIDYADRFWEKLNKIDDSKRDKQVPGNRVYSTVSLQSSATKDNKALFRSNH